MIEVLEVMERAAGFKATVLLTGESGTGKEVLARAIHAQSPRRGEAFVAVNCAAIPEALLESELFGHAKGAFTGADRARRGLFLEADGGTLFLDEVGELPTALQAKLLRVLQEEEVRPLGDSKSRRVDVRVLAATARDLEAEVAAGRFREDLFYRLNVVRLAVPPLRERPKDIPLLVDHFLARFRDTLGKPVRGISDEALERLVAYRWPGNVRELENVIERAIILADADRIGLAELPQNVVAPQPGARRRRAAPATSRCAARGGWSKSRRSSARCARPAATARTRRGCSRSATAPCSTSSRSTGSGTEATPRSLPRTRARGRSRRRGGLGIGRFGTPIVSSKRCVARAPCGILDPDLDRMRAGLVLTRRPVDVAARREHRHALGTLARP